MSFLRLEVITQDLSGVGGTSSSPQISVHHRCGILYVIYHGSSILLYSGGFMHLFFGDTKHEAYKHLNLRVIEISILIPLVDKFMRHLSTHPWYVLNNIYKLKFHSYILRMSVNQIVKF